MAKQKVVCKVPGTSNHHPIRNSVSIIAPANHQVRVQKVGPVDRHHQDSAPNGGPPHPSTVSHKLRRSNQLLRPLSSSHNCRAAVCLDAHSHESPPTGDPPLPTCNPPHVVEGMLRSPATVYYLDDSLNHRLLNRVRRNDDHHESFHSGARAHGAHA